MSSSSHCYYDIFLSFRGEDTRNSFTDHLYTALIRNGFLTFRDDDEAEKGENLKSELEKAIRDSKSSILVLSKDYASSAWCLDELVMILDKKRNSELIFLQDRKHRKHQVLPVFYDVKPSHLRRQVGTIGESFVWYEMQIESEMDLEKKRNLKEKVIRWRSALTEVADLIGLELQNHFSGSEAKFIDKVIKVIGDKLRRTILHIAPYEVGLESRAKSINMWVQDEMNSVSVIAICGMGGIGKTTIAKYVYNQNAFSFDDSCFLADIREVSKDEHGGLVRLQRQLLSDISRKKHGKIHNFHEGLAKIENLLRSRKVLIVLDDVDHSDQIRGICGMQDWLFPGSKVIITTRHERLLKHNQICLVKKLSEDESIKLFSHHAFGEDLPMEGYMEHAKRVVRICEGLPLALKVIGSSLFGKSEDLWLCEVEKLEATLDSEILTKLKTSFDSLQDDYDRRLFLHIACFFVGTKRDQTTKILEKCVGHAKIGIQNLIDRCLLERDSDFTLKMHKLVQDMGREIIRQESLEPGNRSRLWHYNDAFNVMKDETGTKVIEGLTMDMRKVDETRNNAKKQQYDEFHKSTFSKYFSLLRGPFTSSNDVYLRTDALKVMTNLKLLELNYVKLAGDYKNFPKGLVWLSWHGFPLESIPPELSLELLVILDLRHSKLNHVWNKTPFLESLKILNLSYSERLERTPNFLGLPSLEKLILKGCMRLVEVCESIGNLEMLELLDLSDCITLRKLAGNIWKLKSLRTLNISGCNINGFPSETRDVIKPLETIKQIVLSTLSAPRKGPETLWASLPFSLQQLNLSKCNLFDDSFPNSFGNLPSLSHLDLSINPFRRLPNCIKNLSGMLYLDINNCHGLELLDFNDLQSTLVALYSYNCGSLKRITTLLDVGASINLYGCDELDEVEGYFKRSERELFGMDIKDNSLSYAFEQILLEFGITNLFGLSGEVPSVSKDEMGESSSISFTVPLLATHAIIQCLNLFCTFKIPIDINEAYELELSFIAPIYVKIKNETKDLTWIYAPNVTFLASYGLSKVNWEWWSRWRFGNQLEAGDKITITFSSTNNYEVKECGYKFEYQDEEENGKGPNTTIHDSYHNFPELRLSSGEYILFELYKQFPIEDMWFPKQCKNNCLTL